MTRVSPGSTPPEHHKNCDKEECSSCSQRESTQTGEREGVGGGTGTSQSLLRFDKACNETQPRGGREETSQPPITSVFLGMLQVERSLLNGIYSVSITSVYEPPSENAATTQMSQIFSKLSERRSIDKKDLFLLFFSSELRRRRKAASQRGLRVSSIPREQAHAAGVHQCTSDPSPLLPVNAPPARCPSNQRCGDNSPPGRSSSVMKSPLRR